MRRAQGATTVTVEYSNTGRGYRPLATVRTTSRGSWKRTTSFRSGRRYRVVWQAPDGTTTTSPGMRAY